MSIGGPYLLILDLKAIPVAGVDHLHDMRAPDICPSLFLGDGLL
jgi:hypothetical protein